MKRPSILLAALALSTSVLHAQDNPSPGSKPADPPQRPDAPRRPEHPPRPEHGFFALLDANRDGALDREELNRAADALRRFDRDNDGRITPREMHPDGQREQHGRRDGDRDRGPRDLKKDDDRGPKPPARDRDRGPREEARRDGPTQHARHDGRHERRDYAQHRPQLAPRQEGTARPPHDGPRPESRDDRGPRPPQPPSRGGDEHARRPMPPHHHHPHHHGPPPSDRRDHPAPQSGDRDRHRGPDHRDRAEHRGPDGPDRGDRDRSPGPDRRDRPEDRGPGSPRPSGPGPI